MIGDSHPAVWRFDSNGQLEQGWPKTGRMGAGGGVIEQGIIFGIAPHPDGGVWLGGRLRTEANGSDATLWWLRDDGTLHPQSPRSWDRPGVAGGYQAGFGLAAGPDGVWMAGWLRGEAGLDDAGVWRLSNANGGIAGFPLARVDDSPREDSPSEIARDVAVDDEGHAWVTGGVQGHVTDMAVWRFAPDGELSGGPYIFNNGAGGDWNDGGWGIKVDPAGAVWVVGTSSGDVGAGLDMAVWKLE